LNPNRRVVLIDGARTPGAKILVSGGSRCNVTNTVVTEHDFCGGPPTIVRRVLRAFPVDETIAFFREIGVRLHEEQDGKLFPDTNHARDVLHALLAEAARCGVLLIPGCRALDVVTGGSHRLRIVTPQGPLDADAVVLATGGQSLPRSGSDGAGYGIAARLGHTIVPLTPALVPLLLPSGDRIHRRLSGTSQPVQLALHVDGRVTTRIEGSMLWTHVGISGPAALNVSRHWLRAELEGRRAALSANFCGGRSFDDVDREWSALADHHPRTSVRSALANLTVAAFADQLLDELTIDPRVTLAHLTRKDRRRLVHALTARPIDITGSRGYTYAEATAGGVALTEIDPKTMASRVCAGLTLVGEILDVDGRIGGFNFQWAWSSGFVAGRALARAM
jgi:predicted Rossmann fold flavoprotein